MAKNESLTVHVYKPEYDFLKWLVLQKPNIETGGDLFGLWQDKRTAVVQLILGPGKGCKRTTTSFHQDVNYLKEVGEHLTSSQGLCIIGEWHSHHRLGLPQPSRGDQNTVWRNLPTVAGGRFILFIANITVIPAKVNIKCFLFDARLQEMVSGEIKFLQRPSPVRQNLNMTYHKITSGAEDGQDWQTFQKKSDSINTEDDSDFNKFTSNGTIGKDWEAFKTETGSITGIKSTEAASGALSSHHGNVYDDNEENEESCGEADPILKSSSSDQKKPSWIRKLLRFLCNIFCCCCCCCCCEATCDDSEYYCKFHCGGDCRCSDTNTNHTSYNIQ